MNYFWPGSVNTHCWPGLVNTNLVPGPVNANWGPGPVNTNLGPGPVNTNLGPGMGARDRTGCQAKGRGPGKTNTLTKPYLEPSQISPKMNCSMKIVDSSEAAIRRVL